MSDDRETLARAFAHKHGWHDASMTIVAGDASNRKYYRLSRPGESVILMDAPPEKGEDTGPFVNIATYLEGAGLSAPRIIEADPLAGLLLIEDFGDDLFARLIERNAADELALYEAATDVLLHLHLQRPPQLPTYGSEIMADMAALSVTWYRAGVEGHEDPDLHRQIETCMQAALRPLDGAELCLIQRDYHAENLIWLPDRMGVRRVGLLDFQDAMIGHKAYDLVSVLQDARRDVPDQIAQAMISRYIDKSGTARDAFIDAYHLLGLQRNLRILGVFARLCIRDSKPHYVDLIPRVWGHIQTNLVALNRSDLTDPITSILPPPTPHALDTLKSKCPTNPTQS